MRMSMASINHLLRSFALTISTMKVVFAGTPNFAQPSLQALIAHPTCDVIAVYTQPDRPAGRGKKLQPSAVKQLAQSHGILVLQPASLSAAAAIATLQTLSPDLIVVSAYGLLLPPAVLAIPKLGCANVHASMLPRWRGAAPVERAIEAGDKVTGVTLMQMAATLDTGAVLANLEVAIDNDDTAGSLRHKLALAGSVLLGKSLDDIVAGKLVATPQDEAQAVYAHKLNRAESACDWRQSAQLLACKIRALNPWPTVTTRLQGLSIKLLSATPENDAADALPGQILTINKGGIRVATGGGVLSLTQLQKAGGKPMSAQAFLNGVAVNLGDRFDHSGE